MSYQEDREKLEKLKRELKLNHAAYVKSYEETLTLIDEMMKKVVYAESYENVKNCLTKKVIDLMRDSGNASLKEKVVKEQTIVSKVVSTDKSIDDTYNIKERETVCSNSNDVDKIYESYYEKLELRERQYVDDFLSKYHYRKLEKPDKLLKISQDFGNELAQFNTVMWNEYTKKNQLSLIEDDAGAFEAYKIEGAKDKYFIIPSHITKFSSYKVIVDGFAGFFNFDLNMAVDGKEKIPYVNKPAIVINKNGKYVLCSSKNILYKGKIEF